MKISIITPSYNSGQYIERAILSVLKQDYVNWEHIIVDGGSTDGTIEILKKYPHLKWVSEPDRGQSDAMNKGFKMSTGEIIGYLNADDWYELDIFIKIFDYFQTTDADILVGNIIIKHTNGEVEIRTPSVKYRQVIQYRTNKFPPNPVSYFYKRSVQEKYGDFPVQNHMTMDLDFIFYAYRYFKVEYLNAVFGTFFLDGNNKTAIMDILSEQRAVAQNFLRKHDYLRYLFYYFPMLNRLVYLTKRAVKSILVKFQILLF